MKHLRMSGRFALLGASVCALGLSPFASVARGAEKTAQSSVQIPSIRGMAGVGTWKTQAEFKAIRVTRGNRTVFASNFAGGVDALQAFKTPSGKWQIVDGALRQTGNDEGARALVGDASWSDYTLSLKARKISGDEGFLIFFGVSDANLNTNDRSWWNLGGWNNTQHGLEAPGIYTAPVKGSIETGRWYDIRVEVKANTVRAFLDNQLVQSATKMPARHDFGRALVPDLVADPTLAEFDGTFYLYATTDGEGQHLSTSGLPVVWKSKDFLNWSFVGSIFAPNFDAKYWAPSAPIRHNGRFYLFPTLDSRITAVVADSPEGPFRTLDGKDITKTSGWKQFTLTQGHHIDADIFRDDDGTYYMTWSQRFIAKLKPDFSAIDGPEVPINTKRGGYSEGPAMFKRNGIYYYLYTLGGNEVYQYAYMMSRKGPLGPWESPEKDIIATTDRELGIFGPGHGNFFNPKGSQDWVFVYLEYGRSSTNRHVMTAPMTFNPDGTIVPIKLTLEGVGALRPDMTTADINLAAGKTATASSTRPNMRIVPISDPTLNREEIFAPSNALDGSNGSRWMAREDDKRASYQIDLGAARDIKGTELFFVQPTRGHAYQLDYSLDGKKWQRYGGHEALRIQSPHIDANRVRARYLKVTILQGTPGLWEVRVLPAP